MDKPEFVTEEHLVFLDNLREAGEHNMSGAGAYIRQMFPALSKQEARRVGAYWMRTFSERHAIKEG